MLRLNAAFYNQSICALTTALLLCTGALCTKQQPTQHLTVIPELCQFIGSIRPLLKALPLTEQELEVIQTIKQVATHYGTSPERATRTIPRPLLVSIVTKCKTALTGLEDHFSSTHRDTLFSVVDQLQKLITAERQPTKQTLPSRGCKTESNFFTNSDRVLACNLLAPKLLVKDELQVNGTACFNGNVIFCSGISGIISSAVCLCWNGSLCSGLTSPLIIPTGCTLDQGTVLFNATGTSDITVLLFSDTTKDTVDATCKLLSIQAGDCIRLVNVSADTTFADFSVESRSQATGFVGYLVTGGTPSSMFSDTSYLCLENFGPKLVEPTGPTGSLGNYLFAYKTGQQAAGATWADITFDTIGASDGAWIFSGSTEFICPLSATYVIRYDFQYGLTNGANTSEVTSTRILEDGSEMPGSQAAIVPRRGGNFTPGRPRRCLSRSLIRHLPAATVLRLQQISLPPSAQSGRIQPGGASDLDPVSGDLVITRIE